MCLSGMFQPQMGINPSVSWADLMYQAQPQPGADGMPPQQRQFAPQQPFAAGQAPAGAVSNPPAAPATTATNTANTANTANQAAPAGQQTDLIRVERLSPPEDDDGGSGGEVGTDEERDRYLTGKREVSRRPRDRGNRSARDRDMLRGEGRRSTEGMTREEKRRLYQRERAKAERFDRQIRRELRESRGKGDATYDPAVSRGGMAPYRSNR